MWPDLFKLQNLTHDQIDSAILAAHQQGNVKLSNKRIRRHSNTLFAMRQSPYQRLLLVINERKNLLLGELVLGELLDTPITEALAAAVKIYLKYKRDDKTESEKSSLRLVIREIIFNFPSQAINLLNALEEFNIFIKYPDLLNFDCDHDEYAMLLHYLAATGVGRDILKSVLRHGANPHIKNSKDKQDRSKKAFDYVVAGGHPKAALIVHVLLAELTWGRKSESDFTAQEVVDRLMASKITNLLRKRICSAIFRLRPDLCLTFTVVELFAVLEKNTGPIVRSSYEYIYRENQIIGQGVSGIVLACYQNWESERPDAAIKLSRSSRFLTEIYLHQKLTHPYIIKFIKNCQSLVGKYPDQAPGLLMEYADTNLEVIIYSSGDEKRRAIFYPIVTQINEGLGYIHKQGVVHKDIKPNNILLVNNEVRIADFGAANEIGKSFNVPVTAVWYRAPESFNVKAPYMTANDIYSFGVLMGELETARTPWPSNLGINQVAAKVCAGEKPNFGNEKMRMPVETLMSWCTAFRDHQRPAGRQIKVFLELSERELTKPAAP